MDHVAWVWRPGSALLARWRLPAKGLLFGGLLAVQMGCAAAWFSLERAPSTLAVAGLVAGAVHGYLLMCFLALLSAGLRETKRSLEAVGSGNLTHDTSITGHDEVADLQRGVAAMARRYSAVVATVRSEAQLVAMAGERLLQHASQMSERTEQQASNLQQTTASVAELAETVKRNADAVGAADQLAADVRAAAEDGSRVVGSAVESMQGLEQRARQMTEIIGVIDGIAFQTNILALNAAVEAARAGEQGRGFAVVAGEVRTLAQRSAKAAGEVRRLIDGSSGEITASVQRIRQSTQTLASVVDGVRRVADTLRDVAASSTQQSTGLQEIATAVSEIDELTQRNAHMVDLSVQAADRLRTQSRQISHAVADMRLRQGCADEARAMVEKAVALVRREGKEAAVRAFHDPKGAFRDRDMFILVLDGQNYFRAFGVDPSKANKPAVAAPGVNLEELCARTQAAARDGGGWVEFSARHPVTGAVVDKLGYAAYAVDDWIVLCSINRSDGGPAAAPAAPPAPPTPVRQAALSNIPLPSVT